MVNLKGGKLLEALHQQSVSGVPILKQCFSRLPSKTKGFWGGFGGFGASRFSRSFGGV